MAKANLPKALTILLLFLIFLLVLQTRVINANPSNTQPVISEVMIAGTTSLSDEFVELYNPTNESIDVNNWKIKRASTAGTETSLATISGTMSSHGFYLLTKSNSFASPSADTTYISAIGEDNGVVLYNNSNVEIDRLGWGSTIASESAAVPNPTPGMSIERKANPSSNETSMAIGGTDEFEGNGYDTDNNANDFVVRTTPQPQNSQSSIEPPIVSSPTPSNTPTPTLTLTPTPTEEPVTPTITTTPNPTDIPVATVTPEPTVTIAPILTNTPIPTATLAPTITQTPIPTQAPTVIPSPIPTNFPISPTITNTPSTTVFPTFPPFPQFPQLPQIRLECVWIPRVITNNWFTVTLQIPLCHVIRTY